VPTLANVALALNGQDLEDSDANDYDPARLASVVVGTGGAAVPIQLGEPLASWVLDPDLDKYRRMDPHVIVNTAVDTIAGEIADDIRAGYLACYEGDRFVESMRYARQLPSGQWQARYRGPDGLMRPADTTFPGKTDAEVWLTCKEAEILNGDWINPDAGKVLLSDYGTAWIEERPNLRPKTIRLYRYLLRRHIQPHFAAKTVAEIKEAHVRSWRKNLLDSGLSTVTTAKAYRLLKAILNTAVDDGLIRRNPCRIKGASQEQSAERPVLTIAEVYALADAIDQRYRALVLLGTFASLSWPSILSALTWTRKRSCSLARCARHCGTATSTAAHGCPHLPRSACPASTFTTYAVPGTPLPK
jgi:Phage integrase, N-terminal SAM-like domain